MFLEYEFQQHIATDFTERHFGSNILETEMNEIHIN